MDYLDYSRLIDAAMHYVVRGVLRIVSEYGLPGDHYFFITFNTEYPGVKMSDSLKDKYPEEMTIVIQHQFWDLQVEDDYFSIVLSFDNVKQSIVVPFDSLISFADPSVKFGLQFHSAYNSSASSNSSGSKIDTVGNVTIRGEKISNVVALDEFRKSKSQK